MLCNGIETKDLEYYVIFDRKSIQKLQKWYRINKYVKCRDEVTILDYQL